MTTMIYFDGVADSLRRIADALELSNTNDRVRYDEGVSRFEEKEELTQARIDDRDAYDAELLKQGEESVALLRSLSEVVKMANETAIQANTLAIENQKTIQAINARQGGP